MSTSQPVLLVPGPIRLRVPALPRARGWEGGARVAGPVVRGFLCSAAAVALLAFALPRLTGASWDEVASLVAGVGMGPLAVLALVWVAGLWVHTPALAAPLPGLSHRGALVLNLSGSCVSNLVPLGGAAGTVVNWRMVRGWGFDSAAFALWAVVSGIADVLLKIALPLLTLTLLVGTGHDAGSFPGGAAYAVIGAVCALFAVAGWAVGDELRLRRVCAGLDRALTALPRLRAPEGGCAEAALTFRRDSGAVLRQGWRRIVAGKLGYAALQALLLLLCLRAVGVSVPVLAVLAALSAERVLSLLAITPGATGFVEVGMVATLVAFGVDPAHAAAGALLYRLFTFGMEIPVGGALLAGWLVTGAEGPGRRRPAGTRATRPAVGPAGPAAVRG